MSTKNLPLSSALLSPARFQAIILAAGNGSRFAQAGYTTPKPLLPLGGTPMTRSVLADLEREFGVVPSAVTVACRTEHSGTFRSALPDGVRLVEIPALTAGAAVTALACLDGLNLHRPVVIANSDQQFRLDEDTRRHVRQLFCVSAAAGFLLTMPAPTDPEQQKKWSYAIPSPRGTVSRVIEKPACAPSNHATIGVYAYRSPGHAQLAIERMIEADDRTNGEFYLAPAFNHLRQELEGYVYAFDVERFVPLGTPEDYEAAVGSVRADP